jgi:hypothetical protein
MWPRAEPREGINAIMTEMLMLTGNANQGKAKRGQTMEPEGKIWVLGLVTGCQARGCGDDQLSVGASAQMDGSHRRNQAKVEC